MRESRLARKTNETEIELNLNLDGSGNAEIETGIGFFNHMLELWSFHGRFDLNLRCDGDLDVDPHHSVEDCGISLGKAFAECLGDKRGIERYSFNYLPMDETLCRTAVDVSGRPYHVFRAEFSDALIGALPTQMVGHFFYSFASNAGITLHQEILYGENDHHKAEALFKGLGRTLSAAAKITGRGIPSTKGNL